MSLCLDIAQMRQLELELQQRHGQLTATLAKSMAQLISSRFTRPGEAIAWLGEGYNGLEALHCAMELAACGWKVHCIRVKQPRQNSATHAAWQMALQQLPQTGCSLSDFSKQLPQPELQGAQALVLLDGIFGLNARGELPEDCLLALQHMQCLRRRHAALLFAIDLPSGFGCSNYPAQAYDCSLVVHRLKTPLLLEHSDSAGYLQCIDIAVSDKALQAQPDPHEYLLENAPQLPQHSLFYADRLNLAGYWPRPKQDAYKHANGKVAIVAGSPGMWGALLLACKAAQKTGAGMIYALLPQGAQPDVTLPAEVIRIYSDDWQQLAACKPDCILVGPGLLQRTASSMQSLEQFLLQLTIPLVLDASALAFMAKGLWSKKLLESPRNLITPHPGELRALISGQPSDSQPQLVSHFVEQYRCALLAKDFRSCMAMQQHFRCFVTAAGPAMGNAGQGDVLAGVAASLLAKNLSPYMAGLLASYLCARSADLLCNSLHVASNINAAAVADNLPSAIRELHAL